MMNIDGQQKAPDVSVITPIYNGELWIDECFGSIFSQTAKEYLKIEVAVYDDSSTDRTPQLLEAWQERCNSEQNITLKVTRNESSSPRGVGFAKNRAVEQSCGTYLCFQDVDDIMKSNRIYLQYSAAKKQSFAIVGSQFERMPEGSTARFTRWANTLKQEQLSKQIYTSNGPTVIMPTWFCSRQVFDRVGGFSEAGTGTPEDLIFFYQHLDKGGDVCRVDENLLTYRYHPNATTFSIDQLTIWDVRIKRLQEKVLSDWSSFIIWNAGKQGRHLYRSLEPQFQSRVAAFCDVDRKKVGRFYVPYEKLTPCVKKIPILHFTEAKPPFIICVKLDLTGGSFEENLRSLNLIEGRDFVHFS